MMTHVPPEFLGRARAFRARIGADDAAVGMAINRITAPLLARRRRKATFRPETLIDAERQFQFQVPAGARLTLKVERDRHGLRIEEFRVAAGEFRFCSWEDDAADADPGVVRVVLEATGWGAVGATANIVASVSLHALARRYQRGFDTSDAAILAELRELAMRHAAIVEAQGDFSMAFDGGSWVGEVARTEVAQVSCPVLAVRTFAPAGAPVRGTVFAVAA
jgi:hypothetical protein